MRRSRIPLFLVSATLALAAAGLVRAQGLPPLRNELLGTGWTLLDEAPLTDLDPAVFTSGDVSTWGGPDGARARIVRYEVADTTSAVRRSWDAAGSAFESYRAEIDTDFDYGRERELTPLPLPDGCSDGRRIYGVEVLGGDAFPVGLTLCAADPNVILLVYASGTIGDRTGYEASDAVVARALTATFGDGSTMDAATAERGRRAATGATVVPTAPVTEPDGTERPDGVRDCYPLCDATIVSHDIYFDPKNLTIPADTDVTLRLRNEGAAPHSFVIEELGVRVEQAPGGEDEITLTAPAGEYEYVCDIPGHKEAGMIGTLTAVAAPDAEPQSAVDGEQAGLIALLPDVDDVPAGLVAAATDERSEQEVAESLGGTDRDARLLDRWGWEGNVFRDFIGSTANGTYALNVAVHQFADDASADDALIYFSDKIVPAGYAEAEIEPLGDAVRLLTGAPVGDPTAIAYLRVGAVLYRIGATAADDAGGDPAPDVLAVARAIASR